MHTDPTLDILSRVTSSLGDSLREFREKTCTMFRTRELERERAARQRRQEKKAVNAIPGAKPIPPGNNARNRKLKELNLKTYKCHALGDYASTIRRFGTTDSYTTQPVSFQLTAYFPPLNFGNHQSELEHRTSKSRLPWTNGRSIPHQLAKIERRQRRIRTIREKLQRSRPQVETEDVANDPRVQYSMGKSQKWPVHVPTFLKKNDGDPAIKVCNLTLSFLPCS
jgi:hypothetical protein